MDRGVVFITGAGERLGAAIAKYLLEEGYGIVAHYRRHHADLSEFLDNNKQYIPKVTWLQADFPADLDKVEALPWDNIVALIPCAALFETGNLFDDNALILMNQLSVNALVPLQLARIFKKKCSGGAIITFIDGNIQRVNHNFQNYRISKLLLQELTRQMAVTIGEGFRVNGIAPGTVLPPDEGADESYERARKLAPTGREVAVESILSTVKFLLENRDITGEIIAVDGGVHAI